MPRVAFIDGATGTEYVFEMSMNAQSSGSRERPVKTTPAAAAGWTALRATVTQGDRLPEKQRWAGTIATREQHRAISWLQALSAVRTLVFRDPTGDETEVIVSSFSRQRRSVVRGPRGGREMWTYTLEIEHVNS